MKKKLTTAVILAVLFGLHYLYLGGVHHFTVGPEIDAAQELKTALMFGGAYLVLMLAIFFLD